MAEELDERSLEQLLGYIGVVRAALCMQNWTILLHREPHDLEDVYAHTWQSNEHWVTNVQVTASVFELEPYQIRNTVVHELVHAQHRDVSLMWEGCVTRNDTISQADAKSWDADYRMHFERFVSWITDRIEGEIPLWDPRKEYKLDRGLHLYRRNSSPSS